MTTYPQSLLNIVRRAAAKHRDDIDKAVDVADREWGKSDERAEWIDSMIRRELRTMIHEIRHQSNVSIRRESGAYGQPAKVSLATGAVARVATDVLRTYSICGVTLALITGKQLREFAKIEHDKAEGSAFNARLCERLTAFVTDDKTVGECLTAKKVTAIMKSCGATQRRKSA